MRSHALTKALLCAAMVCAAASAARSETAPVSFAGKQIKISIGYSPTGFGYDTYGRLLARHLGKYLPGNPSIVPQNRPGAGSLNLANYIFNAAPRDGTEIALVGRGVAMEPLLGGAASQAKFDSTKFAWLGSMNNEVSGFFIRQPGPVKTLSEAMKGVSLQVGSTGIGGDQHAFTAALNALLGTKLKPICRLSRHAGDHAGGRARRARRHRRLFVGRRDAPATSSSSTTARSRSSSSSRSASTRNCLTFRW